MLVLDIEIMDGEAFCGVYNSELDKVKFYNLLDKTHLDTLKELMLNNFYLTWNGKYYDVPLISCACDLTTHSLTYKTLERASNSIIVDNQSIMGFYYYELNRRNIDIKIIHSKFDRFVNLKSSVLNVGKVIQGHSGDSVYDYNSRDLKCLYTLYDKNCRDTVKQFMGLHNTLGQQYPKVFFLNDSETTIARKIFIDNQPYVLKFRNEKPPTDYKDLILGEYKHIPKLVLSEFVCELNKHSYNVSKGFKDKRDFRYSIKFKNKNVSDMTMYLGLGGLHGCINDSYYDNVLDVDVASFYPSIIENLNIFEGELKERYVTMKKDRVSLKKTDPILAQLYKIILNSIYGKLKDSKDYNPLYHIEKSEIITLNGQLILLNLCYFLQKHSFDIVYANTDGFVVNSLGKDDEVIQLLNEECTDYILEYTKYTRSFFKDVSNLIMIDEQGLLKTKGSLTNISYNHSTTPIALPKLYQHLFENDIDLYKASEKVIYEFFKTLPYTDFLLCISPNKNCKFVDGDFKKYAFYSRKPYGLCIEAKSGKRLTKLSNTDVLREFTTVEDLEENISHYIYLFKYFDKLNKNKIDKSIEQMELF